MLNNWQACCSAQNARSFVATLIDGLQAISGFREEHRTKGTVCLFLRIICVFAKWIINLSLMITVINFHSFPTSRLNHSKICNLVWLSFLSRSFCCLLSRFFVFLDLYVILCHSTLFFCALLESIIQYIHGSVHRNSILTFRHRASSIQGQAFHYSPEKAFYIFNQQIYFII